MKCETSPACPARYEGAVSRRALRVIATMLVAVSAGLTAWLPASVYAQDQKSKFGDWVIECRPFQADGPERCLLSQNIILRQSGKRVLNVAVARPADDKPFVAAVTAPLGILLPAGLILEVDDAELVRIPLRLCNVNGCQGSFPISDSVETAFTGGTSGRVIFRQPNGRPLRVEFSLNGFADAYKDLQNR